MFPFRDHNPSATTPWVVFALIAVNVAVFLYMVTSGQPADAARLIEEFGLVPAQFRPVTFVTSQFLHAGLAHLGGNMLFLWIFGDNLEDEMGHLPFLGFYLAGGVAAGLGQVLVDPASTVPMVGASGAIAGVMGGYLLLFPRARVDVLIILVVFFRIVPIPAWIVLGAWFAIQLWSGAAAPSEIGGVAYVAHAAGFLAGLALTVPLFARLGGPAFWARARGRPPHPGTSRPTDTTRIPSVRRHR